jgi:hypothetical protein
MVSSFRPDRPIVIRPTPEKGNSKPEAKRRLPSPPGVIGRISRMKRDFLRSITPPAGPPLERMVAGRPIASFPIDLVRRCAMSRKLLLLAGTAIFILTLNSAANPAHAGHFSKLFCPECWTYLGGANSVDTKGNCAVCGKYPVELEVLQRSWYWCAHEGKWLEAPCKESPRERAEGSFVLLVGSGPRLVSSWYCPRDRKFGAVPLKGLAVRACVSCGGATVQVPAVQKAWYWCALEGVWAPEPCPMNLVKKCCTKFEGVLLAAHDPGPIAKRDQLNR